MCLGAGQIRQPVETRNLFTTDKTRTAEGKGQLIKYVDMLHTALMIMCVRTFLNACVRTSVRAFTHAFPHVLSRVIVRMHAYSMCVFVCVCVIACVVVGGVGGRGGGFGGMPDVCLLLNP